VEIYESLCEKSNLKNIIIVVDIPKEIGEKRITGRRVCMNCGKVYNVNFEESMPKELGKCDSCGHDLTKRSDDNLETYDHRFDVYVNETAPILDYYKDSSKVFHVDGTRSLDDVFGSIDKIIKENL
jgi:adenylate kinase